MVKIFAHVSGGFDDAVGRIDPDKGKVYEVRRGLDKHIGRVDYQKGEVYSDRFGPDQYLGRVDAANGKIYAHQHGPDEYLGRVEEDGKLYRHVPRGSDEYLGRVKDMTHRVEGAAALLMFLQRKSRFRRKSNICQPAPPPVESGVSRPSREGLYKVRCIIIKQIWGNMLVLLLCGLVVACQSEPTLVAAISSDTPIPTFANTATNTVTPIPAASTRPTLMPTPDPIAEATQEPTTEPTATPEVIHVEDYYGLGEALIQVISESHLSPDVSAPEIMYIDHDIVQLEGVGEHTTTTLSGVMISDSVISEVTLDSGETIYQLNLNIKFSDNYGEHAMAFTQIGSMQDFGLEKFINIKDFAANYKPGDIIDLRFDYVVPESGATFEKMAQRVASFNEGEILKQILLVLVNYGKEFIGLDEVLHRLSLEEAEFTPEEVFIGWIQHRN